MKRVFPLGCLVFGLSACFLLGAELDFPLGEDSKPHENVPKGELLKFEFETSKIFPGTSREVSVYVPRQYDGSKPACVYVNQDGVQWNAPVVFDNLISKGDIPVLIGVFIRPGVLKALDEKKALNRFNRSLEYDGLGPDYARFVLEEILPAVERLVTTDGRKIRLSSSGNDRAIGGSSSGAIAAFTAAWERPDAFSRVFNVVCTMVGLRGANEYPTLIRKTEPKAIRVFQQDGSNDNNIYGGDWWMANQELERSLTFAGYEHDHVWGEGGHNGKHGTAVFPEALRFLWKDWPKPVKAGLGSNRMLQEVLLAGELWQAVSGLSGSVEGLASNSKGEVFFRAGAEVMKIGAEGVANPVAIERVDAFGKDEKEFSIDPVKGVLTLLGSESKRVLASGLPGLGVVTGISNGDLYALQNEPSSAGQGRIWLIRGDGAKTQVDGSRVRWGGIAASPDQSLLYASDSNGHWVYSFQIRSDGSLANKQRYYWLHRPDTAEDAGAGQMCVDRAGRLYVATRMGIQVCDQAGRVNVILPLPNTSAEGVAFGGFQHNTLYAISGGRLYQRKLNAIGVVSAEAPIRPEPPKL